MRDRGCSWLERGRRLALAVLVSVVAGACHAHSCPRLDASEDIARWASDLRARKPLALDPRSDISVKRDARDFVVDVEAGRFAAAFRDVMSDGSRRFGLIQLDRLPERAGQPFAEGEHFQGRYAVEPAVERILQGRLRSWFGEFAESAEVERWLCEIETRHTSDFGVISRIDMSPPPGGSYVLEYVYLEGSPIAGRSTFTVSDITDASVLARNGVARAARVRQVLEYQEQSSAFAHFFTRGGLRLHNQVVYSQVEQSAALAGARILESDVPAPDREF